MFSGLRAGGKNEKNPNVDVNCAVRASVGESFAFLPVLIMMMMIMKLAKMKKRENLWFCRL